MFGFERHNIKGSYCFFETPEKAFLDGDYLNIFSESDMNDFGSPNGYRNLASQLIRFKGNVSKKLLEVIGP